MSLSLRTASVLKGAFADRSASQEVIDILNKVPAAAIASVRLIQKLTYTAQTAGAAGNNLEMIYIEDGVAGAETVNVAGSTITVHIGASGVLSSTSNQVKAAIIASGPASALVSVAGGDAVADQIADHKLLQGGVDAVVAGGALSARAKKIIEVAFCDKSAKNAFIYAVENDSTLDTRSRAILRIVLCDKRAWDELIALM